MMDGTAPPPLIADPRDPMATARAVVAARFQHNGHPTLHHHRGAFYRWTGTHYALEDEAAIRAVVYKALEHAFEPGERPNQRGQEFKPTRTKVGDVMDALRAVTHLSASVEAPAWLESGVDISPNDLIAVANGIINIATGELLPHSPTYFNLNALDFAYDPDAPAPAAWLVFLDSLWPDDPDAIATLQEILGYLLTGDTSQQKAFLIEGPKRSGKGTIARVATALLGRDNVCAPTLAGLVQHFGEASLIGKRAAIIADARLSGRVDQQAVAECILAITGEDTRTIPRKYLGAWTGKLPTRFLILTNELPRLADASGALASRFIILTLRNSFYGKEDLGLTNRLLDELPGILNWSLAGLNRLRARRYFIQPASSQDAMAELEALASPIKAFIQERCEVGPGRCVKIDTLYSAWCEWCKEQGRDEPGTKQTFGRNLRSAVPGLKRTQPRDGEARDAVYEGITLLS